GLHRGKGALRGALHPSRSTRCRQRTLTDPRPPGDAEITSSSRRSEMTDRRVDTVPTDLPVDPAEALAVASRAPDQVTPRFIEGVGAEATRIKESRTDFATELDLELERRLSDALREGTGLEVHGEEFGGPSVHSGTLWVLDPIDGTANYSLGIPTTGILAALVHDRQPVLGLTWLPLLGLRFTSIAGGALQQNGEDLPAISDVSIRDVALGLGSLKTGARTTYPSAYQRGGFAQPPVDAARTREFGSAGGALQQNGEDLPAISDVSIRDVALGLVSLKTGARTTYPPAYRREVFEQLTVDAARTRKFGSTGVDLSFVASGRLSSAVSFGNYAWDNAAGASHVRAAGGVVTDLAGNEWSTESQSMLAAGPRAHEEVLSIVRQLGDPSNFSESGR